MGTLAGRPVSRMAGQPVDLSVMMRFDGATGQPVVMSIGYNDLARDPMHRYLRIDALSIG